MPQTAAPARRRQRLPADERRELIVASAARLFALRPYAEVSTVDIAREAGVARGLLNHYFSDKRGLYLEVVRQIVMLPELEETPALAEGTAQEKVDAAITWFMDSAERHVASYATVLGGGVGADPEVAAIVDAADDLAARRVLQLVGIDEEDGHAQATVRCYGGMAKAAIQEWSRKETLTREQAHRLLSDVLLFLTGQVLDSSGA
ncbi:TetR/AcrR family transcriptional regulator [Nocardioides stalactiti]|uniref:TetR/AcrR family transcriptional regulator n=1 Tax=Nocardioides stalactiti TaxID=2755356 RepID=UPI0016004AF0|nr:TetR/AcrR family transcriptional regulator [Nocardioides stalactiti]